MSLRTETPSLRGATGWLNSAPLDTTDLRGRPVLVDFWTLTCINWLRQEPYVRAWSRAYRDDGLVVVGVHTPEFAFEQDTERVRAAARDRGIDYPVALDNDYEVWQSFDNHYWPALYFLDANGSIVDTHVGEGRYEESERVLQRLLGIDRDQVHVQGTGIEAGADWERLRTPETYLGAGRTRSFASPHRGEVGLAETYEFPSHLRLNHWALSGRWTIDQERVVLHERGGSIACRFQARDAHLVLSSSGRRPIPFRVFLDGEAPGPSHGVDVDPQGHGVLRDSRLYQLVREHDEVRERILEIAFLEPGAEAYAFTFG